MSDQIPFISRKSLIAYIRAAIGTAIAFLIWAVATIAAGTYFSSLAVWAIGSAICLLVLARGLYKFLYLASVKWIVGEEDVRIVEGVLPWAKRDFTHPYEIIFEAFYNFGFFAKMFGYGTLVIRRTEGMTTAESEPHMRHPGEVVKLINGKVNERRKVQKQPVVTVASGAKSQVEELAALASLKASGDISEQDYEIMKRRIVGGDGAGEAKPSLVPPGITGGPPS